ncbi:MAG: M20 family metallopeptidase [Proteobacteria bacterium]|nr:M20 family metallopeptidase [Pseudomonadota bacterium]
MSNLEPRIQAIVGDVTAWRRDIHAHPELMYDCHRTASVVAEKLRAFGCDEVVTGLGKTGVVGVIRGRSTASGRVVALRADMDALPIHEETNLPHASKAEGKMHACGHDGHTAMLLGAARLLAETRDFDGTVVVVFQPAEEGGAGARAMLEDGLVSRFGIGEFYGMHNMPGIPVGEFAIRPGPLMAATVQFTVQLEAKGAHAAQPHHSIDPVVIAGHIVTGLQSIASRTTDPLKSVVVSVTAIHAGSAYNVIPSTLEMKGTVRYLDAEVGRQTEERFRSIVRHTAEAHGARATINYAYGYPVTVNDRDCTGLVSDVAETVALAGPAGVDRMTVPMMGGEDFSFMLEERPGAMIFIGNGDSAPLHNPAFDFNDAIIPYGIAYWQGVVSRTLPLRR